MVDMKEIKSIGPASFTLMSSSIQAVLAFIFAVICAVAFGTASAFVPELSNVAGVIAALGVAIIVILPISSFLTNVAISFISIILYNGLAPRIGGIKLGFDGNEVRSIPAVPFALIMACIAMIWAFIIGVLLAATLIPLTGVIGTSLSSATGVSMANLGTVGIFGALFLIIGLPIIVFIAGFIVHALAAVFYNVLIPRVGGVKLELAVADNKNRIESIPVLPASLAISVVFAVFGLIIGLISLIMSSASGNVAGGFLSLVYNIIGYFLGYFILVALITIFYNLLAPKLGGIRLHLD
jgi:hypothetical protein